MRLHLWRSFGLPDPVPRCRNATCCEARSLFSLKRCARRGPCAIACECLTGAETEDRHSMGTAIAGDPASLLRLEVVVMTSLRKTIAILFVAIAGVSQAQ